MDRNSRLNQKRNDSLLAEILMTRIAEPWHAKDLSWKGIKGNSTDHNKHEVMLNSLEVQNRSRIDK